MTDTPVPEFPSALLERAVALIEQRAAAFGPPQYWVQEVRYSGLGDPGAAWAELIGPPVASPLVEWLQLAKITYEAAERRVKSLGLPAEAVDNFITYAERTAVAFARVVLGETS